MTKETLTFYKNGATIRLHNRRISFFENKEDILIIFDNLDSEPNRPSFVHECCHNKIRKTTLKMSLKAMESLVFAYIEYRKSKKKMKEKYWTFIRGIIVGMCIAYVIMRFVTYQ